MMPPPDNEEERLRRVALQNAQSILHARHRAEEELRQQSEWLRVTLASIGDAVISTDAGGRVNSMNAVAESLTAWSQAEALGHPLPEVFQIINEQSREPVENPALRALQEGVIVGLANHTILIGKDGTERPIDDSAAPIRSGAGAIIGTVLIFRDITERHRADTALRESEQRYRTLFESMLEGFCIIEVHFDEQQKPLDFTFLEVNPAFEKQTGLANVKGRRMRELVPGIEQHWFDIYGRVALTGEPARFEQCAGTLGRWFEVSATCIHSRSRHVALAFNDITQRHRDEESLQASQARFDLVRDAAQVGFWFCDLPFDLLIWDARVKEHFWLPEDAKVTIETFYERLHPDDRERTRQAIAASIENKTRYDIEYRTLAPDGRAKWIRAIGRTFYESGGKPIRFDGVTLDITERRQTEEALQAAQEKLEGHAALLETKVSARTAELTATNEQLETFVHTVAHDLRGPLRSMMGFSELLLTDYQARLDEQGANFLQRIHASAKFMDQLLLDLLAYGQTMKAEMELGPVEVEKAWQVAVFQVSAEIEQSGAHLEVVGPLPVVQAHEATLGQCLTNLLSNALKFVPPGVKPRIRFRAEELASRGNGDGARVRLWLEDNGIGIAPEHRERAFRVFERLESALYPGTGIGLSIVRKGLERMGGQVGLESAPEQGSHFWIELAKA